MEGRTSVSQESQWAGRFWVSPLLSPSPTDGQAEAGCVRDAAMHEGGRAGAGAGGALPAPGMEIQAEVVGGF